MSDYNRNYFGSMILTAIFAVLGSVLPEMWWRVPFVVLAVVTAAGYWAFLYEPPSGDQE